jgi:hypothetical protein
MFACMFRGLTGIVFFLYLGHSFGVDEHHFGATTSQATA